MSDNHDDEEPVGYGQPPRKSRFKPGQSGNPRGRRKGSTNFITDLKHTLQTPVVVQDRGKPRTLTTQKAILMRLREKALKGDPRALDRLIALAQGSFVDVNEGLASNSEASDLAMLEHYRERFLHEQFLPSHHAAKPSDTQEDSQ